MFTIYQLVQDFATIHSMKIKNHQKVMCHSPKMIQNVWSPFLNGNIYRPLGFTGIYQQESGYTRQ
jgi:hypothetical protein